MTRKTALWLLAGVLGLAGLLAWAFAPRAVPVEVATVVAGPFEAGIDEEARTRLRERYVVSAPLAGRWLRPRLREGDAVRAGEVLGHLEPLLPTMLDARARLEQQGRVQAAAAGLEAARAHVQQARVGLERARADLARSESLLQQGFVSQAKAESDRLAQGVARAELQAALEGERAAGFELEVVRTALAVQPPGTASAPGAVPGAVPGALPGAAPADALTRVALRAPVSGRVLKLQAASEATVPAGAPLLELGDVGGLEVVAELLTTDALQVRPGSAVRIDRWGGPQRLEGVVRQVEPGAFTKVSALGVEEQRVRVVIDLRSPPELWVGLGDGYRVAVRVVTRTAAEAVQVPVGAVFPRPAGLRADDGCPLPAAGAASGLDNGCVAAFVVAAGRAQLRAVRLEGRETRSAWVRSGLAAGEQVIVYPAPAVEAGVRVAVRTVTGAR
jgi:HlyD family secretion protein